MEDLQSALSSHGVMVSFLPEKGRCLVSTKDFSPGEVIIWQEPYASIPNNNPIDLRCDGCFASSSLSSRLKKCSACQMTWYCGSICQKSEWKLHQLECRALVRLSEDRRKMVTPSIRLMIRLLLKGKLQVEEVIPTTATDKYVLVEALMDHMSDISEEKLVLYAQMANLVNLILPSLEINIKGVAQNFSKLACNAHTICDSELRPLGTGLYPIISIINHSCMPNSVLVFEGRLAVVRAVEPIAKGDEVSISYIEIAASTMTRQKALKEQYHFTCTCPRCVKVGLYEDLQESAILEGYRYKKIFVCQRCGLVRNQKDIQKIAGEVEELLEKASTSLSYGNHLEAGAMYKTIEQLQMKLCHSLSISLMRTRETLLKILMELKDWRGALAYCRLTIPVYQRVYPCIHPLLGLQYYTCGKLEWLLGDVLEALKSLTKAMDILRITHGTSTPFMKELLNKLEEARAEASYIQTNNQT
ncbi:SET domain group 37 isoform X2 [Tasmannia lanceolata]|uniref:SET domain group 37 isoform X2 n=1 Tax=Tasmannia lanceolata TaxID=3420 RepID=UPI0040628B2D